MVSVLRRWQGALRALFGRVRVAGGDWVEPWNEITRAALDPSGPATCPAGPLYERDTRDLVFTLDDLLNAPLPPAAIPAPSPASSGRKGRRPGRAA